MMIPAPLRTTTALPALVIFTILMSASAQVTASTLDRIKERGFLNCGVHSSKAGFSVRNAGTWQGLEVSFCRALAAATLGDSLRVRFTALGLVQGHTALQSGDLDIVVRQSKHSLGVDTTLGLVFVEPLYYRSLAILVTDASDAYSASDLDTARLCVDSDQRAETITSYLAGRDVNVTLVARSSIEAAAKVFEQQQCDAIAAQLADLHYAMTLLPPGLEARLLPDKIGVRATGPLIRGDDLDWYKIVRWTLALLLIAEDLEIIPESLADLRPSLKATWTMAGIRGNSIGLSPRWHDKVLTQVGNYNDIYQRSLGEGSPFKMPRGLNALARDGGLHVAPSLE